MGRQRHVSQVVRKKSSRVVSLRNGEFSPTGEQQFEMGLRGNKAYPPAPTPVSHVPSDTQTDGRSLASWRGMMLEDLLESFTPCDIPEGTPGRWLKMMGEMTSGYNIKTEDILKTFDGVKYDGMVVVGPIEFTSLCEHHLLPFTGGAWVGYIPEARTGRIVGLSKLARLVGVHAARLQVQERLTNDIAHDIHTHLNAEGAGCRVISVHSCMACRGVKKRAPMRTQTLLGAFMRSEVRQEFYELCKGDSNG